jgi:N-acetylated-alpha-linked acidic dipeptidase
LDHAGIASLNFGFGSADSGGVYHSIYDSLAWFDKFSDTDLSYGKALSQVMITSILRLSDASVLPFEFGALARTIHGYVDEIERSARRRSGNVDLRQVQSQLSRLENAARLYNDSLPSAASLSDDRLRKLNESLQRAERTLLLPGGLPGRDWYKHALYAPGLNTGYDPKTLPGVREAVEAQHWDLANQQARRLAQNLGALASQVEQASRISKSE